MEHLVEFTEIRNVGTVCAKTWPWIKYITLPPPPYSAAATTAWQLLAMHSDT
jgi:hypothetical protein